MVVLDYLRRRPLSHHACRRALAILLPRSGQVLVRRGCGCGYLDGDENGDVNGHENVNENGDGWVEIGWR